MHQTDVVIAGAGVIGMALALELRRRDRRVTLVERAQVGCGASNAAAGMLAVHDPANPPELQPLADLSARLYPAFLDRLARLAPQKLVPFETCWTLERTSDASTVATCDNRPAGLAETAGPLQLVSERSLDPRALVAALASACRKAPVRIMEGTSMIGVQTLPDGSLQVITGACTLSCTQFVDCTGAWSSAPVRPVKGQMLRVQLGNAAPCLPVYGNVVLRTPTIYIVPRLDGSAVIGATLEDKGFCIKTKEAAIADLRARASALLPAVADAPELERWAGLRPATVDFLPLLGALPGSRPGTCFVANGHFRNGILLAPATGQVMAQILCGEPTDVSLRCFDPGRFAAA